MNAPRLKGREILVVEDQPIIAMEIVQAFRDAGATVTTTMTLKHALLLVEHDSLAAAILDHDLGDGDSDQLCARLKERNIPFVIYSGFTQIRGACKGAPHINKPASGHVLVTTVEGLLKKKPEAA